MPRKRVKIKEKLGNFADWQIDFMKNGPPDDWEESPHRWTYFDGRDIWERLKKEPGINIDDFPWAIQAYDGGEKKIGR